MFREKHWCKMDTCEMHLWKVGEINISSTLENEWWVQSPNPAISVSHHQRNTSGAQTEDTWIFILLSLKAALKLYPCWSIREEPSLIDDDFKDLEAFANIPPQVSNAIVGVVGHREHNAKLGHPNEEGANGQWVDRVQIVGIISW